MITEQFLPPADGTATLLLPPAEGTATPRRRHRPWLLQDLERPGDIFRDLGPNWFASVMGTGIVAIAASSLPFQVTGLHVFALVVWALAAAWLLVLSAAWAVHWTRYTARAREHADNPVMAQFWGAPPMALMTVGTGTLLLGKAWIGAGAAVDADWALWGLGTALGLVTACWIPYLMMTRHEIAPDGAFGGWLMPVVPPMVSAANGALLVPYAAAGQARQAMLLGCYAMFGISLFMSVIIITLLWGRLVTYKTLPAAMVPTCWIVLGPLGQSVTAAGNLAKVASLVMHGPYAAGADVFALLYGVPTWGFAMAWLAITAAVTLRAGRSGLPFGLTWWSFTFPVGTCVTGTIGLAARTGLDALRYGSAGLFLLLLAAWLLVAVRTVHGGVRGQLFLPTGGPPGRGPVAAVAPPESPSRDRPNARWAGPVKGTPIDGTAQEQTMSVSRIPGVIIHLSGVESDVQEATLRAALNLLSTAYQAPFFGRNGHPRPGCRSLSPRPQPQLPGREDNQRGGHRHDPRPISPGRLENGKRDTSDSGECPVSLTLGKN
jgi:C4-dicarboxylate transporter/malic acid transport protein